MTLSGDTMLKKTAAIVIAIGVICSLAACTEPTTRDSQLNSSTQKFDNRKPPKTSGDAEYSNYTRAQEDVYDSPSTILWCTVFPPSNTAPIYTVPIAGKLTSSSTSYYPGNHWVDHGSSMGSMVESQSVDGMFHGSPPAYRYGFTPSGQYWDFTNLAYSCTTALTSFQRQTLKVATVDPGDSVTKEAEALLKKGDAAGAQALIDGLTK
ncbi:hypothetical protein F1C58_16175 (plasmid) [Glaciihabitans sp. INWT7]|uniref:hypothetical protein n=1 Tax=Glaciihabitans sp. INWT7 TaxID=2596912 RepID=UPI0016278B65|nr:hypothetical protein [Glaciihabitans sp. INWT7]QNE48596.1 hypothetical protein F1C58_16175 [Glaciihabitans sp. INWT7]